MKNKKILIGSIIGLVLVAGAAVTTVTLLNMKKNDPNTVPPDSNYVTDKNQPITNGTTPSEDKVITPSPSNNNSPSDSGEQPEKPSITRAEQSGNNIRVSAVFTNASSGSCILTLQQNSTTITKTAAIIIGPSYYTCNGFLVPRSELPAAGQWTATVTHQIGTKSTVSDVRNITIQ